MDKVSFQSGYGDVNRTIRKKIADYGEIDKLIKDLGIENNKLTEKIQELKGRIQSWVESCVNVEGMDKAHIQEKIQQAEKEITELENKIEDNKDLMRNTWYGFHERGA